MTTTYPPQLAQPHLAAEPAVLRQAMRTTDGTFPLLLATDGSDAASAATRVADALARRRGAVPHAIHVLELSRYTTPELLVGATGLADLLYDEAFQQEQRTRIQQAMGETIGQSSVSPLSWPIDIAVGEPATCIIRKAQAINADLIVMGLRHHGLAERMIRMETTRQVMRQGGIPVLGVRPTLTGLPRRVIAAVDFSRASLRAVAAVLRLMDDSGMLLLAYVQPPVDYRSTEAAEGERIIHTQGVEAAFRQLREDLAIPNRIRMDSVMLSGDPAEQLEKLAQTLHPDVLTIGSQRHSFLNRVMFGSVTTTLVQQTICSVLVTPPECYSANNPNRSANCT